MLFLTRRESESIIIGDDITVKVLAIKGQQVRFGINAPRKVSVHRDEIYQLIQEEKHKQEGSNQASADKASN